MVNLKSMLPTVPLMAVIITSIVAIVLLSFGQISENFAIIMLLTLLSAYILDQVIENVFYKEKFGDVAKILEQNTNLTESILKELQRQKVPCELVDPCKKSIWEFEEELHWYNAPLILAENEIFGVIKKSYSKPEFNQAQYIFYQGQSDEEVEDCKKRIERYNKIKKQLMDESKEVGEKLTAKVIKGAPPSYSFFLGKKGGREECIMYVMQKPFAMGAVSGEEPGYVFIIREEQLLRRIHTIFNNEWPKGELINKVSQG
ncbi:MAG: hypothetical protein JSW28_00865 [Thermoplasmata archaeon]|nr:MAG: hypothetical protein JSW28_00865 [Thermoplasmata archaeon]